MTGAAHPDPPAAGAVGPAPERPPRRISVVIPARDAAGTLGGQLDRLLAQQVDVPWEIVVADNGSTDATAAVATSAADRATEAGITVRVVNAGDRRGPAHARNVGAAAATGDLLCFTDADDLVEPGWLDALAAAAVGHHLVAGRLDVDTVNPPDARAWRPRPLAAGPDAPPFAPSGNLAVWADVFRAAGGFDEDLLANEDVELSGRLVAAGARLGWAPAAVVHYRLRATAAGITRQAFGSGRFAVIVAARRDPQGRSGVRAGAVARRAGWLVVRLPYLAVRRRRGLWLHRAGALAGEVVAALVVGWRRRAGGARSGEGRR